MTAIDLPKSLFIIGSPRGGTSVLFKTLAGHPAFAFTTNVTRRCRARFGLVRLLEILGAKHRPVEAGALWKSFWPSGKWERTEEHLTDEHRRILEKIVRGHVRHFRREVFLNKRPDMSIRIRWVAAGLPNAKFVHIVRDGRAVASSILEQCKIRDKPHWSFICRDQWADCREMDSATYSGTIWSRVSILADRALEFLGPERGLTVRYEDFIARPVEVLTRIAGFIGIPWGEEHEALVPELEDRNYKWREKMSPEEQERMLPAAEPGLKHFGYG